MGIGWSGLGQPAAHDRRLAGAVSAPALRLIRLIVSRQLRHCADPVQRRE